MTPTSWICLSTIHAKMFPHPHSSHYPAVPHHYFWMRQLPSQVFRPPLYPLRPSATPSYPCHSNWVTQWSCTIQRPLTILVMIQSSQASGWLPASWSIWTTWSVLWTVCNGASCWLGSEPSGPWIRSLDDEDSREGFPLSFYDYKVILLIIRYPR